MTEKKFGIFVYSMKGEHELLESHYRSTKQAAKNVANNRICQPDFAYDNIMIEVWEQNKLGKINSIPIWCTRNSKHYDAVMDYNHNRILDKHLKLRKNK